MSLTAHQQHVLNALQQAGTPLTAYALLDLLRPSGFSAPTQVYRALERLSSHGLVHRLETLNAYVSCSNTCECRVGFRVFAICDNCGLVHEFFDKELGGWLEQWTKDNAFKLETSTIELHGCCSKCSSTPDAETPNGGGKLPSISESTRT